jgi:hypothetical protein
VFLESGFVRENEIRVSFGEWFLEMCFWRVVAVEMVL